MSFEIKNWSKFQHYTDRHPPWIKLYHDLLDDDDFAGLDHFAQLLYFKLLMAGSRKDNRIPEDVAWMSTELTLPRRRVQRAVETLVTAGFMIKTASTADSRLASNGASTTAGKNARPSRARAPSREVETEVEVEETQDQNPVTDTALNEDRNGSGHGELDLAEINRRLAEAAVKDMPA